MTNLAQASHRRILIVDPDPGHHERAQAILSGSPVIRFEVDVTGDSQDAAPRVTESLECLRPYALVIVNLPPHGAGNCVELIHRLWDIDGNIQVLLCLAHSEPETRNVCDLLGISDRLLILRQPYQEAELQLHALTLTQKWRTARQLEATLERQSEHIRDTARVVEIIYECERELADSRDDLQQQTAHLSNQLKQRVDEILGTRDVMVFALERLAESRDAETGEHLERLRAYSQILAEELAVTGPYTHEIDGMFLRNFALSTPLHDIGKVGVPDSILRKPSSLEVDEFDIMKQHTLIGAEALRAAADQSIYGEFLLMAAEIARSHHERFDGKGYPDGLAGTEIPLPARIVAVADVFDALTSRRVYKEEQGTHEAREIILAESGGQFDPEIVTAFERRYQDFLRVKSENIVFCRQHDPVGQ